MRRLLILPVLAALCWAPAASLPQVPAPWPHAMLWKRPPEARPKPTAYLVYNKTGLVVFVHHKRTGAIYTFQPWQRNYLEFEGRKIEFDPGEIQCWSSYPPTLCTVRPTWLGDVPGLVLERLDQQPIRQAARPKGGSKRLDHVTQPVVVPSSVRTESTDLAGLLKTCMERMVHIYYHSRGSEKDRKLDSLHSEYDDTLRAGLPKEILPELNGYEAVCQCIHEQAQAGLSIHEIFARKLCGDRSTKRMRSDILSKLGGRAD